MKKHRKRRRNSKSRHKKCHWSVRHRIARVCRSSKSRRKKGRRKGRRGMSAAFRSNAARIKKGWRLHRKHLLSMPFKRRTKWIFNHVAA